MADRSRMYKNKDRDHEEMRRRRMDTSVELRKAKKDDNMQKRRNINFESSDSLLTSTNDSASLENKSVSNQDERALKDITPRAINKVPQEMVDTLLKRETYEKTLHAAEGVRKELSKSNNAPITEYVDCGVIPALIPLMRKEVPNELLFEVAWILTNIASGDTKQTLAVAKSGAITYLVEFMNHGDKKIVEQAIWALTNILGESPDLRDNILEHDFLASFFAAFDKYFGNVEMLKNMAWTLSNLCRHKESPISLETFQALLPYIKRIFTNANVTEAVVDATWALVYASEVQEKCVNAILQCDILPIIIGNLSKNIDRILSPSLRVTGNIACGSDDQTELLLKCGFLEVAPKLLGHNRETIVKETCWVLSNIAAGTVSQVQELIEANILTHVLHLLENGDIKTQKECLWIIGNMCQTSNEAQKQYLVGINVLTAVIPKLKSGAITEINNGLDIVICLFDYLHSQPQAFEKHSVLFETALGLEALEDLQEHEHEDIYNKAYKILDIYFSQDTEEADGPQICDVDDQTTAVVEEQQRFQF